MDADAEGTDVTSAEVADAEVPGGLVLGPRLTGTAAPVDVTGVLLAACGGLSYAVHASIGGRLIGRGHPSGAVTGALFGAAALLVLSLAPFVDVTWLGTVRGAAVAGCLALFTVHLAYRLFGHGLRRTSASAATVLTPAEPAVAAVLGVTVLGERLPCLSWCGPAVLGAGLVLLALPVRGAAARDR
ncbi:DMT family transporter [Streptomyces sp. NPDC051051]|uniref:DMT family transporter n=1 Tax=Streptomyces sp. NPDC051051 TaxID=3155666 RepID=UPI00342692DD